MGYYIEIPDDCLLRHPLYGIVMFEQHWTDDLDDLHWWIVTDVHCRHHMVDPSELVNDVTKAEGSWFYERYNGIGWTWIEKLKRVCGEFWQRVLA